MDITEICAYLHNYFPPIKQKISKSYIHSGTFVISGQSVTPLDFIKADQYFRIYGSDFNDGVYCNNSESLSQLKDEIFDGEIHSMAVPPTFLKLCEDIQKWSAVNESADSINMSPFVSESFSGDAYSYSKPNSRVNQSSTANAVTWQEQFSKRLNIWRKI